MTRKMHGVLCIGCFVLFAATVQAAAFTNGPLTLQVPNGWQVQHVKEKNITAGAPEKGDYGFTFTVLPGENAGAMKMAQDLAKEFNGTTPELVVGTPDYYTFEAIMDGTAGKLTLAGTEQGIMLMSEIGDDSAYAAEKRAIWNSLDSADPAIKAVLDGLIKYHTLGSITINVPPGWTPETDAASGGIGATSPDGKCAVGLFMKDTGAAGGPEVAAAFSQALGGTTPESTSDDGSFNTFECILDGMKANFSVVTHEGKSMAYYEGGNVGDYWTELNLIVWNSLQSSDPGEQALFDTLNLFEVN